jgi:hypothetical protein
VLKLGPFEFGPARARVHGQPPIDDWEGPLQFALWCQRASPWWIGDMLNAGDARFGERFYQICEGYGVSADQLQRYQSVARRVPPANRRAGLSWSAHAMVARLPVDEQHAVLIEAERRGWTSEEIRRYLLRYYEGRKSSDKPAGRPGEPKPPRTNKKRPPQNEESP